MSSDIDDVQSRLFDLNKSYLTRALEARNPLITQLTKEYLRGFGGSRPIERATFLCAQKQTIIDKYWSEEEN